MITLLIIHIQYLSLIFHNYMDSTSKTGLWTTIPYACMWGCSMVFSFFSDFLIRKNILSTAVVRKVSTSSCPIQYCFISSSDLQHSVSPWACPVPASDCGGCHKH